MKKILVSITLAIISINISVAQCTNATLKNESGDFFFDNLIDCDNGDVVFEEAGGDARLIFRNSVTLNSLTVNFQNGNKPITIIVEDGVTLTIINNLTFGGQPNKDKFLIVEGNLNVGETLDFGNIEFEIDGLGSISAKSVTGGGDTTCSAAPNGTGTGTCPTIEVTESCTGGGICEDGALPIELKSFTASKTGKNISLNWVTAKEENFSHFEIERTFDQENWEQIGLVQGQGESMSDVTYNFMDRSAPYGVIYYRLKAVDIDESFEYFPVVQIENGFNGELAVSPNPVQNIAQLKIQVPQAFRENLTYVGLFDLSGIKIQEFIEFNPNYPLNINQSLKSGMYILKVNHNGLQENIRVMVK